MKIAIPAFVALVLIGVTTIYQGNMSERWNEDELARELEAASKRVENVPLFVGDWKGSDEETDESQLEAAHAVGSLTRDFRNVRTGEKLSFFVICGKPRHVAIHTPDDCYVASGFEMLNKPEVVEVETEDGPRIQKRVDMLGAEKNGVVMLWSKLPFAFAHLRRAVVSLIALLVHLAVGAVVLAGGGAENCVVVVNQNSWASKTVANHFIQLRNVPSCNVVYVDWDEGVETTDVDSFRSKILTPVLTTIAGRHLDSQIDYVIYSVDFPFEVQIQKDIEGRNAPKQITPSGSITGLTYFWELVTAKNPNYVRIDANGYYRRTDGGVPASHGFRSWYGWDSQGQLVEAGGNHYVLSTMLGVTTGRGNSVNEVLECLKRSASADATSPRGTIYFARNEDVRSQARHNYFTLAADALQKIGVQAEVIEAVTPLKKPDVQGAMLGTHTVDWGRSGSTILPGAICEHFTSFGGMLQENASQTPLSEFIRYGAAGSSGTVIEPYAIAEKFPSAFMQLHYARGCSLAESFYQAVAGPYQLLIVGDPLCRPWAIIPLIECEGLTSSDTLSGVISLKPSARTIGPPIDRFELFVDGQRHASSSANRPLNFDTRTLLDGYHEFRIVGIEAGNIESQGSFITGAVVNNHGRTASLSAKNDVALWGQPFEVTVDAPGAALVALYHNKQRIASLRGEQGTMSIDPKQLGLGPVTLEALALGSGGPSEHVLAKPLQVNVVPGPPLAGETPPEDREIGWLLQTDSGVRGVVTDFSSGDWLRKAGAETNQGFQLSGWISIKSQDVYQFHLQHRGRLTLSVDGQPLLDADSSNKDHREMNIVPVHLAAGSHRVEITLTPTPETRLRLQFGSQDRFNGPGVRSIRGRQFWHAG
ncbi:Uncharacterized protein SCF082_LOCUS38288 [Durusdinium trenchii]|uniref:PA14 domain-containing protein n=1 Tax=Durusdinium trenchii TaxID=1381693 RepID=A0ABP0PW83_9DINO